MSLEKWRAWIATGLLVILPVTLFAQGASIPFVGLVKGEDQRVEITADSLKVDQNTETAVFSGNVLVGIQNIRMSANEISVEYSTSGNGSVRALKARGNIVVSNGQEAAEAQRANYEVARGVMILEGDVILTQGPNAISGERLVIDLNANTATMTGRVQTIFQGEAQ